MTEKDELERGACAKLLDCLDDLDSHKNDLRAWTDSLEELVEIEEGFFTIHLLDVFS